MLNIVCSLLIAIKMGGLNIITKADVEGKLLKEGQYKFIVDFSEGVKKFKIAGSPSDYSKVLVEKDQCVKE